MTTTLARRDVGRPRVYSDETIFHGTDVVLRRDGLTELTLEAIAHEVGCTRQALVRRYGSKQALLLAFVDAMVAGVSESYTAEFSSSDSAVEALRARFADPPNSRPNLHADARVHANLYAFMLNASSDPAYAERFAELNRSSIAGIEALLQTAIDSGELEPMNTRAVAHVLYAVWAGETVTWCVDPASEYSPGVLAAFDLIIEPHRSLGRG